MSLDKNAKKKPMDSKEIILRSSERDNNNQVVEKGTGHILWTYNEKRRVGASYHN